MNVAKEFESLEGQTKRAVENIGHYTGSSNPVWERSWNPTTNMQASKVSCNWISQIVDVSTAFAVGETPQISNDNGFVNEFLDQMEIPEIYKQCLITGSAYVLLYMSDGMMTSCLLCPSKTVVLEDEGELIYVITKESFNKGDYYEGTILTSPLTEYVKIDQEYSYKFIQTGNSTSPTLVTKVEHLAGRCPVIKFQINKHSKTIIEKDILSLAWAYDNVLSVQMDEVNYNSDSYLLMRGFDTNALSQKDENGITPLQQLRQSKVAITPDASSDMSFITKSNDNEKIFKTLQTLRELLHVRGQIVDVVQVTSGGVTSGVQLKLRFQPQLAAAKSYTSFFEKGLKELINLTNYYNSLTGDYPVAVDYDVIWHFDIPSNKAETFSSLLGWKEWLSRDTILRLLEVEEDEPIEENENKIKEEEGNLIKEEEDNNQTID